jgi:acetyl/propionyl-CoA carboxylase alpha subunit
MISHRLDFFHPWIRKLQVLSPTLKQVLKSLLPSTLSMQVQSTQAFIKDVLNHPAFNADEVDTDMLQRLQDSIDSGGVQIIYMHIEHVLELFRRPVEKVLRELMAGIRLAGYQQTQPFGFQEYKDPRGN